MNIPASFASASGTAGKTIANGGVSEGKAPMSSWLSLGVLVIVIVLSLVDKLIFTLVAEPLRHTLALSDTQLGLLQGIAFTLATGVAMVPFGWLSDRFDRRWVLATAVVIWSSCAAFRGTADSFSVLFFATVGLGLAEAAPFPINNSLIPDLFPRSQRVAANTIFGLVCMLSAAIGAALGGAAVTLSETMRPHLPVAMQHLETWRLAFFITAAVGGPIALLVLALPKTPRGVHDVPARGADQASRQEFGVYIRQNWRTLSGMVLGSGFTMVGYTAVGTWIPIMVARRFGVTPQQLGNGIGASFFIATLAGTLLAVYGLKVARRRHGAAGTLRFLAWGNLGFALTAPLLMFVRTPFEVFCALGLIVTPLIGNVLVSPNAIQDLAPALIRARVLGVLAMAGVPFQVVGPIAIGGLSDTLNAVSPNALVIAIVSLTLVMGILGALALRLTESSFARLTNTLNGRKDD